MIEPSSDRITVIPSVPGRFVMIVLDADVVSVCAAVGSGAAVTSGETMLTMDVAYVGDIGDVQDVDGNEGEAAADPE